MQATSGRWSRGEHGAEGATFVVELPTKVLRYSTTFFLQRTYPARIREHP